MDDLVKETCQRIPDTFFSVKPLFFYFLVVKYIIYLLVINVGSYDILQYNGEIMR